MNELNISTESLSSLDSLPLTLSPIVLWGIFVLILFFFTAFSIMLFYHWKKYDWKNKIVKKAFSVYFTGGILFFIIAAIFIFILEI